MGEAWRQLLPEGGDADADFLKLSLHGIEALEQQRDGIGRLNFVPPKRLGRVSRLAQAVAIALLLVTAPQIGARADQAPVVAPLPMSTAKAP